MRTSILLAALVLLTVLRETRGEDWTQFRGAQNSGIAEGPLPERWGPDQNIAWKVKIPGVAWSSPIVSGDRVFVTTAVTENQPKPASGSGGFGGGPGRGFAGGPPRGPGGPGGGPGRGPGRFTPPQPGQVLSTFLQDRLQLSEQQKQGAQEIQQHVDQKLGQLLSDEQNTQLDELRQGGQRPGRGFGRGGFGGFPTPGQILASGVQDDLELSDEQKERLAGLQKEVDERVANLLTKEQNEQLENMRSAFRGGPAGRGPGGFGSASPPDAVYQWLVYCIDRKSGEILWSQLALEGKPRIPTQRSNTFATETPVTDGERVYAYFGMHGLFCFDFSGNLVWKKDLGSYPMMAGWGTASSPVLDEGRLFVLCDNEEDSFLVALDAKTGDELWRVDRTEKTTWSTPFLWRNKLRTELVTLGSPKLRSYDPATGKQLWELSVGNGQCSASPVGDGERLYAGLRAMPGPFGGGGGRGGGLFAVRAGASGDISLQENETSNDGVAWTTARGGPEMSSPLVYEGHVYTLSQNGGLVTCLDAKTGEQVYRSRLPDAKSFWASPWAADGKIYCLDEDGTTHVLAAGPEYQLLAQNPLNEMAWASTAVDKGAVLLRSLEHLYCISR